LEEVVEGWNDVAVYVVGPETGVGAGLGLVGKEWCALVEVF